MPKLERVVARPISPRPASPEAFGRDQGAGAWSKALQDVSDVATEIGVRVQQQRAAGRLAEFRRAAYEKAFELKTRPEYEDDEAQFDSFLLDEMQNTPEGLLPMYQEAFRIEAQSVADRVRLQVKADSWGKAIDAGTAALGRTIDETVTAASLAGELGRAEAMSEAYAEIGRARARGFLSAEVAEAAREDLRDRTYDALAGRLMLEDPRALSDALANEDGEFRRNMDGDRLQQWRRAVDREIESIEGEEQDALRWAAWKDAQAKKEAEEKATDALMTMATDPKQGITVAAFEANKHKLSPTNRRTFSNWMANSGGFAPEMRPDEGYYQELRDQARLFPAEFSERDLEAGLLRGELAPMRKLQQEKRMGVESPESDFESIVDEKIGGIKTLSKNTPESKARAYEFRQKARKWVRQFVQDKKRHPDSEEIDRRMAELSIEFTEKGAWMGLTRSRAPYGALSTVSEQEGETFDFHAATPEQMEAVFEFMRFKDIPVSDETAEETLNLVTKKLSARGRPVTAENVNWLINRLRERAKP